MFDLKTRALLHHTTSKKKEIYKRRIMVGDILGNKTLYADFPDNLSILLNLMEYMLIEVSVGIIIVQQEH